MDFNLYIERGFPVEWPEIVLERFKSFLIKNGYKKEDVLHVYSDPIVVGESLVLVLKSVMPTLKVYTNRVLTPTHPTFICETDLVPCVSRFDKADTFRLELQQVLPKTCTEFYELLLAPLHGPARHDALQEAKRWKEEHPQGLVLADICFTGTYPLEVRRCYA